MRRDAPSRAVIVPALITALLAVAIIGMRGGTSRAVSTGAGTSDARRAVEEVDAFFKRFVTFDGRVDRRDQDGDTVSEGQAYAMLMAVAVGDEARFDRVWRWTKVHMQRPDGLISWRWHRGKVIDPTPAADADIDIARALLIAEGRFRNPDYGDHGRRIAASTLHEETVPAGDGQRLLVAGPWARDRVVVNPSYLSPRAFDLFARATRDERWTAVTEGSYAAVEQLTRGRLPSDWAAAAGDAANLQPIGGPDDDGRRPLYGFDAARTPIRMAEDCRARGSRLAASMWERLKSEPSRTLDLYGRPSGDDRHPVMLVGAAAAAHAAGAEQDRDALLERARRMDDQAPTYYGGAWVVLGRIILQTDLLGPCSSA